MAPKTIPSEAAAVLARINQQMEQLRATREMVLKLYGISDLQASESAKHPLMTISADQPVVRQGSRADQIRQYLIEHGPSTRQEIINALGIPEGTVGFTLSKNRIFTKDNDDKWTLAYEKEINRETV